MSFWCGAARRLACSRRRTRSSSTTSKIVEQNVVLTMAGTPASEAAPQPPSDETKAIVNAAWDNHFAAFGAQDVEKILADYSEESEIRVYDQTTGEKKLFVGLEGVREAFVGLFASLPDLSELAAPPVDVSEARSQVLLVWECPSSGVVRATDTFLFDAAGKIVTQNVVMVTSKV